MFDQTFVTGSAKTLKPWTVAVSLVLQTLGAAVVLILPLLHVAALHAPEKTFYWLPLKAPPPLPVQPQPIVRSSRLVRRGIFIAPTAVPRHIDMTADLPNIAPGLDSEPVGPVLMPATLPVFQPSVPAPQPPVAMTRPAPPLSANPVRVSGGAQAARLIFAPKPEYPALAKAARVQGVVRMEAIIGRDGAITNLRVVGGPPLLVAAAIAAVQQWRYHPTLLNAEPVEVATEIEVNFTLSH
jgi:protein TonB